MTTSASDRSKKPPARASYLLSGPAATILLASESRIPPNRDQRAAWIRDALCEHEGPLLRYATRLLGGDLETARDIVQDTFLRLWEAPLSDVRGHVAEWLFTVCRNRAIDVCRKERRMSVGLTEQMIAGEHARTRSGGADAGDQQRREADRTLLGALVHLPDRQQEILRLKFQNGLSYQEIGRVMDLSVSNVGFLIHTAIKALRERLQTAEQTLSSPSGPNPR